MHDDGYGLNWPAKTKQFFPTFTGRQKWWLPSFKTCVNLQEPFILVVFNLKMEQEFWYSGQKRPGVVHKVAHTACCLNTCSLPLLSLEIHPPANSDIKPGFVRKMLVVFNLKIDPDRKDLVSPTKWLTRPSCLKKQLLAATSFFRNSPCCQIIKPQTPIGLAFYQRTKRPQNLQTKRCKMSQIPRYEDLHNLPN